MARPPKKQEKCPKCGGKAVPICYGYPPVELMKEAEKGNVVLGGCIVGGNDPKWSCKKCRHEWGKV